VCALHGLHDITKTIQKALQESPCHPQLYQLNENAHSLLNIVTSEVLMRHPAMALNGTQELLSIINKLTKGLMVLLSCLPAYDPCSQVTAIQLYQPVRTALFQEI
jgi:hypothetical protein